MNISYLTTWIKGYTTKPTAFYKAKLKKVWNTFDTFFSFSSLGYGGLMKISLKYLPYVLLLAFFIKLMFIAPSFVEVGILLTLVFSVAYSEYESKKSKLVEFENKLKVFELALLEQRKSFEQYKTDLTKFKMGAAMKDPTSRVF